MNDDFDDLFADETPPPPQRPWYLLTGLIIGLAIGLAFAWALSPVRYTDSNPAALRAEFKDEYRLLIAHAYQANENPARALQRLALLADSDPAGQLAAQGQQLTADGRSDDARALAALAEAFNTTSEPTATDSLPAVAGAAASPTQARPTLEPSATLDPAGAIRTLTPSLAPTQTHTPPPTDTPQPSATPRATQTTRPTLPASFRLLSQQQVCDPALPEGLLQIEVLDSSGRPLPGVKVTVRWDGGSETFFTGLYGEISAGYADFAMQPGVEYSLSAGEAGEVVSGVSAPACETGEAPAFQGGWLVQFSQ